MSKWLQTKFDIVTPFSYLASLTKDRSSLDPLPKVFLQAYPPSLIAGFAPILLPVSPFSTDNRMRKMVSSKRRHWLKMNKRNKMETWNLANSMKI